MRGTWRSGWRSESPPPQASHRKSSAARLTEGEMVRSQRAAGEGGGGETNRRDERLRRMIRECGEGLGSGVREQSVSRWGRSRVASHHLLNCKRPTGCGPPRAKGC